MDLGVGPGWGLGLGLGLGSGLGLGLGLGLGFGLGFGFGFGVRVGRGLGGVWTWAMAGMTTAVVACHRPSTPPPSAPPPPSTPPPPPSAPPPAVVGRVRARRRLRLCRMCCSRGSPFSWPAVARRWTSAATMPPSSAEPAAAATLRGLAAHCDSGERPYLVSVRVSGEGEGLGVRGEG